MVWRRRTLGLSKTQQQELMACRDHDSRADIRERCAAILKIGAGQAPYAVAQKGLLKPRDPDTVYGWLDRYETGGLEGLQSGRHGGNRQPSFRRSGTSRAAVATGAGTRDGGGPRRDGE